MSFEETKISHGFVVLWKFTITDFLGYFWEGLQAISI